MQHLCFKLCAFSLNLKISNFLLPVDGAMLPPLLMHMLLTPIPLQYVQVELARKKLE